MVISMTGFGRSQTKSGQHSVTVEMKSVNHRFCEIAIRMPRQLMKIEDKLKKQLAKHINRGKVDVFVTITGEGLVHRTLQVDWNLVQDYYQLVHKLKEQFSFDEPVQLQDLLQREDFITVEEIEEENQQIETLVIETVEKAVVQLKSMREKEGKQLFDDFVFHLNQFEEKTNKLMIHSPIVIEKYRERLERKMKEFVEDAIDETRILTEVAIFSDKSDITEELTRLDSHVKQFYQTIQSSEPIGRKLDFIIQEMNREVNTIGSKANDSTIASFVVELKTTLEKLREQVQNVE